MTEASMILTLKSLLLMERGPFMPSFACRREFGYSLICFLPKSARLARHHFSSEISDPLVPEQREM